MAKFTKETAIRHSSEEARKNGKKGGDISGIKRRARKTMREELLYLLDTEVEVNIDGKKGKKTLRELASIGLIKRAVKGDPAAYKVIRETIGEDAATTKVAIEGGLSVVVPNLDGLAPEQITELITK